MKRKISIAIIFIFIIAFLYIFFRLYRLKLVTDNSLYSNTKSEQIKKTPIKVGLNEKIVIDKKNIYILADNLTTIQFENLKIYLSGRPDYNNDDYLNLTKSLKIYNGGYYHTLNLIYCNKEERSFGDYSAYVTTDCTIDVSSQKSDVPPKAKIEPKSVEIKNLCFIENCGIDKNYDIGDYPVHITMPYMQEKKYADGHFWSEGGRIQLITGFGKGNIKFTSEEIWNHQPKNIIIGPLNVEAQIINAVCERFEDSEWCHSMTIKLTFKEEIPGEHELKILEYTK